MAKMLHAGNVMYELLDSIREEEDSEKAKKACVVFHHMLEHFKNTGALESDDYDHFTLMLNKELENLDFNVSMIFF